MAGELYHHGTPHQGSTPHSGRYPWGSGDESKQRIGSDFLDRVDSLKSQGMTEVEIAKALGISTGVLRARKSAEKDMLRAAMASRAYRLKQKGYTNTSIAELMDVSEGTVRNLLKPALTQRANVTKETADILEKAVAEKKYIDVGKGSEIALGVARTKLDTAVQMLKDKGYEVVTIQVDQLGTDYKTSVKVLCPPGSDPKETYISLKKDPTQIKLTTGYYSEDGGETYLGIKPPVAIDPKRVAVRYAEDGGTQMDGVVQLRRGVEDISLGEARYAQVRIKVGDEHYLKGMAMYSDDLPDGVDLMFNTNKHKGTPMLGSDSDDTVLKRLKDDKDNPFGATVRQKDYIGKDGKEHLSPINIVNEEGDWETWARSLSSQVLSKQSTVLAKKQLGLAYDEKKKEYDEIMALTNPAVKKKLLESFANDCDASAVDLQAAAMPRQAAKVILPIPDMKETEVYAPGYRDGERVVLVRFPHAGPFEIPELTVNNKQKTANRLIHNALDAIGIHPKVAERLSGADFDGDTVLIIPNNEGKIRTSESLSGLKDFDPKERYRAYEGMPKVGPETGFHKQREMGGVSNLITDMTIKAANFTEIAAAVRHSMVVIDAEKHNLNWRQSYIDNGIAALKEKYQGGARSGASTLISKASSELRVPQRRLRVDIDPDTGEKIYYETGSYYKDKKGKIVYRTTKSTKMAETGDAYTLSSGTTMEAVYADYANKMKALGNQARKSYLDTPSQKYSPSAKDTYKEEVTALNSALMLAEKNAPHERQAQILANSIVAAKKKDNPGMTNDELKRLKGQAISGARIKVGAKSTKVNISPKQWEAIQAGAISNNTLVKILNHTDLDLIRKYATPRAAIGLTEAQIARAKAMLDSGATSAEVADRFGVSSSTLYKAIAE